MLKLKDYKIKFFRVPIFRWWSFTITTPDRRTLLPILGQGFVDQEAAERAALSRIEIDMSQETISGEDLKKKVTANGK